MAKKIKPDVGPGRHSGDNQQIEIRSLLRPSNAIKQNMAAGKKTLAGIKDKRPGKQF